jgi:hypothetical protein
MTNKFKSEKEVLEILKNFKEALRGVDFSDARKQQKYGRLRTYIDSLLYLLSPE